MAIHGRGGRGYDKTPQTPMKTTLDLSNGYTAEIMQDLDALFDRLPLALFETDEGREKVISALDPEGYYDFDGEGWTADEWREEIRDVRPSKPESWGAAEEYFTACGGLCKLGDIPYLDAQSNGYCQGDSAQVFLAATPEWLDKTGVSPENAEAALKGTLAEYSAWAWGDVYGVASICRPDGEEIDGGSCWGFYGSDHKESGLLDFAESCVTADIAMLTKSEEDFPVSDWRLEVANGDTLLGYKAWVMHNLEAA